MTMRDGIRSLVEEYERLIRLEGRESAESFVALATIAPPRVCAVCGVDVPLGTVHDHMSAQKRRSSFAVATVG